MKRLIALALLLFATSAQADIRCSFSPCGDSAGGVDVSSSYAWTSTHCWGGAEGTAGGLCIKSVGGVWSMLSEGATADAFELTVTFGDHLADRTFTYTGTANGVELSTPVADRYIEMSPGTYRMAAFDSGGSIGAIAIRTDAGFCWTGGLPTAGCVTGTKQVATGILGARSGANLDTLGYFLAGIPVETVATTKTPTELECGKEFTNGSDVDGIVITLLDNPPAGCHFTFSITAAVTSNSFTIQPNTGESLIYGGLTCSALTNTQLGDSLHIVATVGGSGGLWSPNGSTGSWICSP